MNPIHARREGREREREEERERDVGRYQPARVLVSRGRPPFCFSTRDAARAIIYVVLFFFWPGFDTWGGCLRCVRGEEKVLKNSMAEVICQG